MSTRWQQDRIGAERGASMVFTLMSLGMVTVLGLALTSVGMSTVAMATAESETTEALAIADAGIEHGKQLILHQDWQSLNQFLQRGDGVGCNFDELEGVPTGTLPLTFPTAAGNFVPRDGGRPFGQGRYYVALCDNHAQESVAVAPMNDTNPNFDLDKIVRLRSVGFGPRGSRASVELMLGAAPMPAVVVNSDLIVSGNPKVTGPAGSIHSNGTLELSGNPCTYVYYASVEGTTESGNIKGGVDCTAAGVDSRPYSAPINIPVLSPYLLAVQAKTELRKAPFSAGPMPVYTLMVDGANNGFIYEGLPGGLAADGVTNIQSTLVGPLPQPGKPKPLGWDYQKSQRKWKAAGPVSDGTYYIIGNAEIGANTQGISRAAGAPFYIDPSLFSSMPAALKDPKVDPDGNPNNGPWVFMSVIAEGNIDADGNPSVSPAAELSFRGRIVMVAGHDIDLGATFDSAYDGLFYARHQIRITGSPKVNGQVIAANLADTAPPDPYKVSNLVPLQAGGMEIKGNPEINYSGNGLQTVKALTWRECRGQWAGRTVVGGVMQQPGTACGLP